MNRKLVFYWRSISIYLNVTRKYAAISIFNANFVIPSVHNKKIIILLRTTKTVMFLRGCLAWLYPTDIYCLMTYWWSEYWSMEPSLSVLLCFSSVAVSWSLWCTSQRKVLWLWELFAVPTWPPWIQMATRTLLSKCEFFAVFFQSGRW